MSPGLARASGLPSEWAIPRFFGRSEVFLPTGTEAAAFDRWAMDQTAVPSPVLMENAGRGAAFVLSRLYPEGPVLVFAGPGNNGGDGLVLARTLAANGRKVRVVAVGGRSASDPLLHGWPLDVTQLPDAELELTAATYQGHILVDALLGTGARDEPREPFRRAIRAMNASDAPTVALDLPSGVNVDSGALPGEAVRAALTVAFGAPKLGTLLYPGRGCAGRIVALEIGFPPVASAGGTGATSAAPAPRARLITPAWAHANRPRRAPVTHKKAEGRLLILAGSPGVAGAAVLAAQGALRAGAGYVRVASHAENREVLQRSVPEALFVDVTDADALERAVADSDALAAGPGMGTDGEAAVRLEGILAGGKVSGVLLDADAITLLAAGSLPAFARAATPERRLLTPHAGEFARLGATPDEIRAEPVAVSARESRRWDAALLLKGRPSVVAGPGPEGPVWVSGSGSSDLARAGTGDVLTGVAGAFLARGVAGVEAAALALHYTGRAAALANLGEALLPTDIVEHLAAAEREPPLGVSELGDPALGLPFVILDLDPAR